jgi:hypothetical protein
VRQQNRQIEENVRMLAGQQHILWHPVAGRYLDITEWMSEDERKWRVRPVINRLLPWFIITHARATENQPIVTFVPGPDRADAELAEVLDIASKSVWFEANMEDAHDRMMGWVIVAGRGHLISRINPRTRAAPAVDRRRAGADVRRVRPADRRRRRRAGAPDVEQGVPFGPDGRPLGKAIAASGQERSTCSRPASRTRRRGARSRSMCSRPCKCAARGGRSRGTRSRHFIRSYHTPEEVYDWFGVDVKPTSGGREGHRRVGARALRHWLLRLDGAAPSTRR